MSARIIPFEDAPSVADIDLRLAPIDVGFDLRAHGSIVDVAPETARASYADRHGERWVAEGTAEEIVGVLRQHGYRAEVRVTPDA